MADFCLQKIRGLCVQAKFREAAHCSFVYISKDCRAIKLVESLQSSHLNTVSTHRSLAGGCKQEETAGLALSTVNSIHPPTPLNVISLLTYTLYHSFNLCTDRNPMVVVSQGVMHGSNEGYEGSVRNIQKLFSRSAWGPKKFDFLDVKLPGSSA